jgi:hypothetical protein
MVTAEICVRIEAAFVQHTTALNLAALTGGAVVIQTKSHLSLQLWSAFCENKSEQLLPALLVLLLFDSGGGGE